MSDEFYLHPVQAPASISLETFKDLPLQSWALALLRVVAGFTFAIYGSQLLLGLFGGSGPQRIFTLLWFAGVLEFFGGLMVALGLFTRALSFLLSGEMAVAFFTAHFPKGWNPVLNGGEPSVLFCFIFLYLSTAGPGALRLGQLFSKSRNQ